MKHFFYCVCVRVCARARCPSLLKYWPPPVVTPPDQPVECAAPEQVSNTYNFALLLPRACARAADTACACRYPGGLYIAS